MSKYLTALVILICGCVSDNQVYGDEVCNYQLPWKAYPLVIRERAFLQSTPKEPSPELVQAIAFLKADKQLFIVDNSAAQPNIEIQYNYTGTMLGKDDVAFTCRLASKPYYAQIPVVPRARQLPWLYKILAHELLHALGARHTQQYKSIMNPVVNGDSILVPSTLAFIRNL